MLFSFLCTIFLAIGIMPTYVQAAVPRLGAMGLLCSLPLVFYAPESSCNLYCGLVNWNSTLSIISILIMIISAGLLISNEYSFCRDSYAAFGVASVIGAMFVMSSNDLITLFLGIELQSFGVYLMAASDTRSLSASGASLKYFLLGALSTALVLMGSTSQYFYSGTTSLEGVVWSESSLILIICGLLFKIAAAPFHSWAPDVYDGVRATVAAWLQALPKVSVVIFMASFDHNILLISSVLSLIIGTVLGIKQTRVRMLLAYSTVSHVGFILMSTQEITMLYIIAYSLTTMASLLMVSILSPNGTIKELQGKGKEYPCLSLSFAITLFSLAGIPPLFGFYAKATVLQSAINQGLWALAIVAVLCSVISAWYYLSLISQMFFHNTNNIEVKEDNINNNSNIITLTYIVSCIVLLLVFYPVVHSLILNVCTLAILTT